MRLTSSIRQKITVSYLIIALVILIITIFDYSNYKRIEREIKQSELINDFQNVVLELRRYEKNYFLYRTRDDYLENIKYLEKAVNILKMNKESFKRHYSESQIISLLHSLNKYRSLMTEDFEGYKGNPSGETESLQGETRKIGRKITRVSEDLTDKEKKLVQNLFGALHRIRIITTFTLISFGALSGIMLSVIVVGPLKRLEDGIREIAEGKFEPLSIKLSERELVSLAKAFNELINRVRKETELTQRHLMHSEKLASIGTMLFGVVHELNNPLSNISTSCQILKEEIEGMDMEHKKELLSQIEHETDRARDVVGTLLEFSRTKEKTELAHKEAFNLKEAVNEIIRLMKGEIPTRIIITTDIPEDLSLFADKQKIQQVFLNLIKNAADAIPVAAEGAISINASRPPGADNTVKITVRDNGAGIEPDVLPQIFNPFYSDKRGRGKGYGFGLFIVHNIIEEHEGSIIVNSQVDRGTAFLIILPAGES